MKYPRSWPIPAAFSLALLALMAVAALALWTQQRAAEAARWREHTLQVRVEVAAMQSALNLGARSVRGFLITGRDDGLAAYRQAREALPAARERLQSLTADNAMQQQRLRELRPLLQERLQAGADLVDLAARQGLQAARDAFVAGDVEAHAGMVSALLEAMDAEELRLLAIREADARREARNATAAMVAGLLLALALVAWAGGALQRSLGQLRRHVCQRDEAHAQRERALVALESAQARLREAHDAQQARAAHLKELNQALWGWLGGDGAAGPAGAARLDDPARLAALERTGLIDSAAEAGFDRFTQLASRALGAPVSLISLVNEREQFFKSATGLSEPWAGARRTPLSHSFCQHVVTSGAPLVVEDAREHPLVRDNRAVEELGVSAYLGVPLATADGHVLGSFCVIDSRPRRWSEDERALLEHIAHSVLAGIAVRAQQRELEHRVAQRVAEVGMLAVAVENSLSAFCIFDGGLRFTYANRAYCRLWGYAGMRELMASTPAEHAQDPMQPRRLMAELHARGSCEVEFTARRRDGSTFEVLMHAYLSVDGGGREVFAASAIDVTGRRRAEQAVRDSLAEKEVLLREVHHRVKNNLQMVGSLLRLQRRQQRCHDAALDAVLADTENRVQAMALVHQQLYQHPSLSLLDFARYLRGVVSQLVAGSGGSRPPRADFALEPMLLGVDGAIPLALIATELVSNALKHALAEGPGGVLQVALRPEGDGRIVLEVADDGPGLPSGFDPRQAPGLGLQLVRTLAEPLQGEARFDGAGPGTRCTVRAAVAWQPVARAELDAA